MRFPSVVTASDTSLKGLEHINDPRGCRRLAFSAALDFFVVDPSGYVRVCNHSPVRLGHVRAIEFVKTHPYWKRFVVKDYLPGACRTCADRVCCDGGCREAAHIVGGAVDSLDPAFASGPLGGE